NGGIFNGPQFRRVYVNDREHGVPFLGSTDMMEADFSRLPLLSRKDAEKIPYLEVREGMSLISCSGTVGRMAYVRPDMYGFWSSQDVMKVVPNPAKIRSGYLHAFLVSRYGAPIISGSAYGAVVQHIEPHHIENLEIPRFDEDVESRTHELIREAAQLRASFQTGVIAATEDLFTSAGLPELIDLQWHQKPRDLGFSTPRVNATTLRALNFSPRAQHILDAFRGVPHRALGEICEGGQLGRGNHFTRIDGDEKNGVRLIGRRQGFWLRPEGRWVVLPPDSLDSVRATKETVLVAAQGTLGENEVYCRSIFATGNWLRFAFSEHFMRIRSGDEEVSGAYLFALLRSEATFRLFRSMSAGGKQQDINSELRKELPVPLCASADRERIAERVRRAYRERDLADDKEDEALRLLDEAVREAAR
ncbi:MAG: methylation-associated defense system restriction endonuclease subunit S MAD5, partial [Candidatus Binatia bacterium]